MSLDALHRWAQGATQQQRRSAAAGHPTKQPLPTQNHKTPSENQHHTNLEEDAEWEERDEGHESKQRRAAYEHGITDPRDAISRQESRRPQGKTQQKERTWKKTLREKKEMRAMVAGHALAPGQSSGLNGVFCLAGWGTGREVD